MVDMIATRTQNKHRVCIHQWFRRNSDNDLGLFGTNI